MFGKENKKKVGYPFKSQVRVGQGNFYIEPQKKTRLTNENKMVETDATRDLQTQRKNWAFRSIQK